MRISGTWMPRISYRSSSIPRRSTSRSGSHRSSCTTSSTRLAFRMAATPNRSRMLIRPRPRSIRRRKSECGLDLVVRGHRLVADDTVEIRRRGETTLIGTCPELTRYHMELRGLGLINIRDLFGVAAIRNAKRVELVVQLERWDPERDYERLGIDELRYDVLGLKVPLVRMPVAPGRSLGVLVEVAARNQLLRSRGLNAARDLANRLQQTLREKELHADAEAAS